MPDAGTDAPRASAPEEKPIPKARNGRLLMAGLVFGAVLVVIVVVGTLSRLAADHRLRQTAQDSAVPAVSVEHPGEIGGATLVLPARLQAWTQAPIYARVDGYLQHWYFDIGATVKQGALLADIDTPEVDQQLAAARAALNTANAQRSLAATTSRRFTALAAQNAASQQDADQRQGDFAARRAQTDQAQADVGRLQALIGFKRLVAPFDGTVTARNTDVGNLIASGQSNAMPLFVVSDLSRLRLYVSVPQNQTAGIAPGLHATFTVPDYPGRHFDATIERSAGAVDPQSGAMLVQLVYDNGAGLLKAGSYAEVTIALPRPDGPATVVSVPASALLFRSGGTTVAVAGSDGTVSIRKVSIVTDLGTQLQVVGSVTKDDWIIDSPPAALGDGDKVHAKPVQPNRHA